jgi:hypothetical protein
MCHSDEIAGDIAGSLILSSRQSLEQANAVGSVPLAVIIHSHTYIHRRWCFYGW